MNITEDQVWERLKTVIDPELNVDIVSLGLIYKVEVKDKIIITMTLTTPGCPLAPIFGSMVSDAFVGLEGIDPSKDVEINMTFDPPWTPDMMTEEVKAELGM